MKLLAVCEISTIDWPIEQEVGWDDIEWVPFPEYIPLNDAEKIADFLYRKIKEWVKKNPEGKIYLQGDYFLYSLILKKIVKAGIFHYLVFPVVEKEKFIKWLEVKRKGGVK